MGNRRLRQPLRSEPVTGPPSWFPPATNRRGREPLGGKQTFEMWVVARTARRGDRPRQANFVHALCRAVTASRWVTRVSSTPRSALLIGWRLRIVGSRAIAVISLSVIRRRQGQERHVTGESRPNRSCKRPGALESTRSVACMLTVASVVGVTRIERVAGGPGRGGPLRDRPI
jgi:hypothetical protein